MTLYPVIFVTNDTFCFLAFCQTLDVLLCFHFFLSFRCRFAFVGCKLLLICRCFSSSIFLRQRVFEWWRCIELAFCFLLEHVTRRFPDVSGWGDNRLSNWSTSLWLVDGYWLRLVDGRDIIPVFGWLALFPIVGEFSVRLVEGCNVAWVDDCNVAEVEGCNVAGVESYNVAWMEGWNINYGPAF